PPACKISSRMASCAALRSALFVIDWFLVESLPMQLEFAHYLVGFLAAEFVGDDTQGCSDDIVAVRLLADVRGLAADVRDQLIQSFSLLGVHGSPNSLMARIWIFESPWSKSLRTLTSVW